MARKKGIKKSAAHRITKRSAKRESRVENMADLLESRLEAKGKSRGAARKATKGWERARNERYYANIHNGFKRLGTTLAEHDPDFLKQEAGKLLRKVS